MQDSSACAEGSLGSRRGPLPVVGCLVEPLYRLAIARRNAAFDAGRGVVRIEDGRVGVVSIGNLTVGGTGKTPMVMHVLGLLLAHGRRPCVAMRGYAAPRGGVPDEADAYGRAFPGVPIVARPDRAAGLAELFRRFDAPAADASRSVAAHGRPDIVVLDDGFQHRRIARDLDVALIDATPGRSVFEDRLLPAGWLREPVEGLGRASAVVLTHAEQAGAGHIAALRASVARHTGAPVAVARHAWTGLRQRIGGEDRMLPLETLAGRRVVGCAAVGHPEAFVRELAGMVRGKGRSAETVAGEPDGPATLKLPDHDPFQARTVERLAELARSTRAEYIVVTDKDWSKLRELPESRWPCPVVRPELALVFDEGREEFDRMVLGAVGKAGRAT
jgi:tetraacyldisaccharide 4'-kinase